MNKVNVLIEGYAKVLDNGDWLASSTATLITVDNRYILVDPGTNRELLLKKLNEKNLTQEDVDTIFVTHYHPDHTLQVGLFSKAIVVDGTTVYDKDKESAHDGVIPGTDIKIVATPGHTPKNASLIVKTEDQGAVVIASDVFWWKADEVQKPDVNKVDEFAVDQKRLVESRKKVLELADFVIPGHGKMFKVKK